ncbi:probable serine/threonine-protein kinase fhkB isoform X1 [Osmia bicornis bicornis]|uniref:probable serine/threonine-protein kinase fhkB isoform X1 n=1 Tax=Osmia bicornis bicornis TaxID=1437191 RepID=UPI001EAED866|nr:probable serine/threonine-protein kinase fhkB isoform X1 [Osmia bicornis bicornis]
MLSVDCVSARIQVMAEGVCALKRLLTTDQKAKAKKHLKIIAAQMLSLKQMDEEQANNQQSMINMMLQLRQQIFEQQQQHQRQQELMHQEVHTLQQQVKQQQSQLQQQQPQQQQPENDEDDVQPLRRHLNKFSDVIVKDIENLFTLKDFVDFREYNDTYLQYILNVYVSLNDH